MDKHKEQLQAFEKQQRDYFDEVERKINVKPVYHYNPINIENLQKDGWDTHTSHISHQIDGTTAEIVKGTRGDLTLQWGYNKWIITRHPASEFESNTLFYGRIPNMFVFRHILSLIE